MAGCMALKKETELIGWLCCSRPTEPCSFGFVSRKGTVVLFPSFSGRSCSTEVTCQGQDLNYTQDFLKPRAAIPLLYSALPSFPHPFRISPLFLSPFGKPGPAALLKTNKLRGKEHVSAGRMLSPSALLARPSAQQTAPAFDCACDAGTWTGGGLLLRFWGGEGGRKVGDEAAWWLLPAPCIKGARLRRCPSPPGSFGHRNRAGITVSDGCHGSYSDGACSRGAAGISGHGRQDPASVLTEGEEPYKPSSPSNPCQREQTGGESIPKTLRAVELQNIHRGVVLEGPWGLLKPEGTQQWRIYGSTNAVLAPAACWIPLIGCTALTTVISIKDLHKTSKCLSHHLLLNHSKHCISCPACLESSAPHGPRPPCGAGRVPPIHGTGLGCEVFWGSSWAALIWP
nr:uncharacterized protein LOC106048803 [Anser cygnoides]XP_047907842.1 uncharacterized protein LOC106048803 [Anser cygnoides]